MYICTTTMCIYIYSIYIDIFYFMLLIILRHLNRLRILNPIHGCGPRLSLPEPCRMRLPHSHTRGSHTDSGFSCSTTQQSRPATHSLQWRLGYTRTPAHNHNPGIPTHANTSPAQYMPLQAHVAKLWSRVPLEFRNITKYSVET